MNHNVLMVETEFRDIQTFVLPGVTNKTIIFVAATTTPNHHQHSQGVTLLAVPCNQKIFKRYKQNESCGFQ